jgi:hypothetical protein
MLELYLQCNYAFWTLANDSDAGRMAGTTRLELATSAVTVL